MLRNFLIVILSSFCLSSFGQDFIVSEITSNISDGYNIQREKQKMLGAKVKMITYDSAIRLTITTKNDGDNETIFDKTSVENIYFYKDTNFSVTLTLNKTFNYINSVILKTDRSDNTYIIYKLKRE